MRQVKTQLLAVAAGPPDGSRGARTAQIDRRTGGSVMSRLLLAVATGIVALVYASAAGAVTESVTATAQNLGGATCDEWVQTGQVVRRHCEDFQGLWSGDVSGIETTDSDEVFNLVSGQFVMRGTARIDNACIGTVCGGTLYSSWVDIGSFDFETFEIVLRETRHFTGGTGPFAHAHGSLQGTFDAVTGVWTYSGRVGF
jgi:hypothetical protein